MADDVMCLAPAAKRLHPSTDFSKCLKCQKCTTQKLSRASEEGLKSFCAAAKVRKDDIYTRIEIEIPSVLEGEQNIFWHQNCYKSYTSKTNLEAVKLQQKQTTSSLVSVEPKSRVTRSASTTANLDLCIICQLSKHKGQRTLCQIRTVDGAASLRRAMEIRHRNQIDDVFRRVADIEDFIASEIKYHPQCRSAYVSETNLRKWTDQSSSTDDPDVFNTCFVILVEEITYKLFHAKNAFDMGYLLSRYKDILLSNGADPKVVENYRTEKLKCRIVKHYDNQVTFQTQYERSKPKLVYSSQISIMDVINTVARMQVQSIEDDSMHTEGSSPSDNQSKLSAILYASQMLRKDMKECKSININPLNTSDINEEAAYNITPSSIYMFLRWVIEGIDNNNLPLDLECSKSEDQSTHRKILSLAQDLIFATSKSHCKTPKHIGLGMAIKHLTGSKHIVKMLHHAGHSVSYDDVQRIDTAMAENIIQSSDGNIVIPSNMSVGPFVHAAADNVDINEETLDGRNTTHATSMVLYQTSIPTDPIVRSSTITNPRSATRKRSLDTRPDQQKLLIYNPHGRRPQPVFALEVDNKFYDIHQNLPAKTEAVNLDLVWLLVRLQPENFSNIVLTKDPASQKIPGWSGFNAALSAKPTVLTNVGYCPLMSASPTEYSTVYTLMKNLQSILMALQQHRTALTLDEAIYCKAKEIQWHNNDELQNIILRMGGFHIILNFLGTIGTYCQESGFEDIVIESNVYGSNTVAKVLRGKLYNRGVRVHKLFFEALFRLKWAAFIDWLLLTKPEPADDSIMQNVRDTISAYSNQENLKSSVATFTQDLGPLNELMILFEQEGHDKSKTFQFWNHYMEMVGIMLRYIRAERTGQWELHLAAVSEMLPSYFAFDHINYARWVLVYLADMSQLHHTAPEVHQQFLSGAHAVQRSHNSFSKVWSDMSLEQTINKDCKTHGGLVGFSTKANAVDRWFITAHERATITSSTNGMLGLEGTTAQHKHKDTGSRRMQRDENDVQSMIKTITGLKNPFDMAGVDDNEQQPLSNIVTGRIAPPEVANDLLGSHKRGKALRDAFAEQRLLSSETVLCSNDKVNSRLLQP